MAQFDAGLDKTCPVSRPGFLEIARKVKHHGMVESDDLCLLHVDLFVVNVGD